MIWNQVDDLSLVLKALRTYGRVLDISEKVRFSASGAEDETVSV